ncbi:hypothetical protein L248_2641 [Schleiferilactobacillus shenzhenensis LY-73]|uniref:Uncharacterized protein n=1 Tax=Schleiferilactobacillus shenzhenensis LY-73 TaxID=1231336 RepID=U4TUL9_9LACO|nr:hypothetical protein L248_2641 [Schleiferilactobacillus shenzhenensis LY-73]
MSNDITECFVEVTQVIIGLANENDLRPFILYLNTHNLPQNQRICAKRRFFFYALKISNAANQKRTRLPINRAGPEMRCFSRCSEHHDQRQRFSTVLIN